MKKRMYIIFVICLLLDILTKFLAVKYITSIKIIPNLLSFIYTENKGAAFSILSNKQIFLIIASFILLIGLIIMYKKDYNMYKSNKLYNISYALIFSGIIGNLLDRIIRGYVVDFISLKIITYYFPIFNLADIFIMVGVFLLLLSMYKKK